MTEDIVGSHLKSQRARGQNQDLTGATTRTPLAPIPDVSVPNASVPGLDERDTLNRRIGKGSSVETKPGMRSRRGEGGKIPAANLRRDSGKKLLGK